jgi:hypothetical protein
MIIAVLLGAHVSSDHLTVTPCVKINKGTDRLGRAGGDVVLSTSVTYVSAGVQYNTSTGPQVSTTTIDSATDLEHWHIHYPVAVSHAVDLGTNLTISIQLYTHASDGTTQYMISDQDTETYTAAL